MTEHNNIDEHSGLPRDVAQIFRDFLKIENRQRRRLAKKGLLGDQPPIDIRAKLKGWRCPIERALEERKSQQNG